MKVREWLRGVRWQGTEVGSLFRQEMGWKTSGIQFSGGLITEREERTERQILSGCILPLSLFMYDGEWAVLLKSNGTAGRLHSCYTRWKYWIYYRGLYVSIFELRVWIVVFLSSQVSQCENECLWQRVSSWVGNRHIWRDEDIYSFKMFDSSHLKAHISVPASCQL